MLGTVGDQATLWEAVLAPEALRMPAELAAVDAVLDDARFFDPFRAHFDPVLGRPSIPMETYLRLMFLKYRYRLGFEPLCREVADSISWQRFCRIPLGGRVPHPMTLMKITTRCGVDAIEGLNEALLVKAAEAKVLKVDRVRADTTVVAANVEYPSDSSLLAKGVARLAGGVRKVQAAGLAARTVTRDRTRSVRSRARSIGANLRRRSGEAKDEVAKINVELAQIAETAVAEARRVVRNARAGVGRRGRVSGRVSAAIAGLATLADRLERIAIQTRQRVSGITPPGATRLVSLHDPDARPIAKGRLGKPVEFGYKAQVVDNDDGIIVDHCVEIGNPPDAPFLVPAVARVARRAGRAPKVVTADRGYGEAAIDHTLVSIGVATVVIPRKGKPNAARRAVESSRSFKRHVRWRTGSEGRISCVKRDFGWDRTRIDGIQGARTWCGHGVFAHNLIKIATLLP